MRRGTLIWLVWLVAVFALLQMPSMAMAVDCAFEDVNDNGSFDLGTDSIVPDADWIGGVAFVSNHPFVVPVGCDKTLVAGLAVTQGVSVTATKITFLGRLDYLPPGGRGVVFIADPGAVPAAGLGNGNLTVGNGIDPALIRAGGVNVLPANTIAVAQKSVALVGTGECTIRNAEIRGTSPAQNTKVGILCTGDMTFRDSFVIGSKVNIQSLAGQIDAGPSGGGGAQFSLAALCDDPATNPNGNGNGLIDDFPCTLNLPAMMLQFPDADALAQACEMPGVQRFNRFQAFNDPLIIIAGAGAGNNLDVRGASIIGNYRVTLAAEDGNLLTQDANIDHGEQVGINPPGGAFIFLFADPATVVRLPVDREDFLGPSAGSTDVTDACYRSKNPVQVGQDAGGLIHVNGVTDPPPCKQNPADFVPRLNGIF
jgi:hypothetical protein